MAGSLVPSIFMASRTGILLIVALLAVGLMGCGESIDPNEPQ